LPGFGLRYAVALALAAASLHTFAQADPAMPCRSNDPKCAARAIVQSPVRKMAYWESAFVKPVEQRVGVASTELVTYLNLDNIQNGYPNKPQAVAIPEDFLRDVNDAFGEMPPLVKRFIANKLAGIHFVRDLGGTGFTEYIFDRTSRPAAGFIVLDVEVLAKQTANAWATWKENTPFKLEAGFRLEAEIEAKGEDNRKNAIQYILLHELGHVAAIGAAIHPRWDQSPRKISTLARYPFAQLSWKIVRKDDRYASLFDADFPQRPDVAYYFGAKLEGKQMVDVYERLERTNFPTLYAATKPGDDFAESFVSYVHTMLLKRPLEIRLYRDGGIAKTYRSCWEEKRCAEKRRLLEDLLKS
jgi:hypothetical protein